MRRPSSWMISLCRASSYMTWMKSSASGTPVLRSPSRLEKPLLFTMMSVLCVSSLRLLPKLPS
uniref:DNA polymerase n=1 Tax=uncultured marine virus TaxID=186617 RepID=A0A0F7LB53_9VIRU|nr:DNA polymerase [uncultured marine virus]